MIMQSRVIIENVSPEIDGGRHFIKRIVGQPVNIQCVMLADGHEVLAGEISFKHEKEKNWKSSPIGLLQNDIWAGGFRVEKQGFYDYKIVGWVDAPLTWQHNIERKIKDNQHVNVELLDGLQYLTPLLKQVTKPEAKYLEKVIALFQSENDYKDAINEALSYQLESIFKTYPQKTFATTYDKKLRVYVDRQKAMFSSWYEFFPRSASKQIGKHGTFKDCEELMPRVAELGFDVVYFPPIHPIGIDHRKGKNNATTALPDDVGSPWAIGGTEGGHTDIHPQLGTLEDFKSLIKVAAEHNIELAMDYALQCSPNHPYVKKYPQWFKWRPDGTVQYAENPPKKYQDILPINFETEDWKNLWDELLSILMYWCNVGIKIFRVDNPHTKSFYFWEWAINEVKKKYPDTLFLAEAFTRPHVMHSLAKMGFSQSYTYYTWRNTKAELIQYMQEISNDIGNQYFRPNFWPNTPDINPYILQNGNQSLYMSRYFMAATLSSNYGMYGPVYEFIIHEPMQGKEEYYYSEKYEIKTWDWNYRNRMTDLIKRVNQIRKENPALQLTYNFINAPVQDEYIIAYLKQDESKTNNILCVVNMDPYNRRGANLQMPLSALGVPEGYPLLMHDLITGAKYIWTKEWNYVELSPELPFHLFRIERV
ncbi:MAG: alpha-1,4-glucan--maltose-1-phosphate maltosyltransferase [Bacteroidetes bacterium]|nr:MAG: alpha-1,4-glucan--maltose-1-phosphate maltosyltransferase [Bacteroidota bacterium]TAG85418.1 MAG: alpha-1,4-glucan--maltose-1-phosphate maltosyltransferase [Bacteroidota bacterium]